MADPFEQIVEAMARRHASCLGLRFEDADDEDREIASVMLQTAVAHPAFTGLSKLVEERDNPDTVQEAIGGWRMVAGGHHPEGEPSEEALKAGLGNTAGTSTGAMVEAGIRRAYAIDHPQDRG